jgi:hypothetical protein
MAKVVSLVLKLYSRTAEVSVILNSVSTVDPRPGNRRSGVLPLSIYENSDPRSK